jgi:hypothetical protein
MNQYECDWCGKFIATEKGLKIHIGRMHKEEMIPQPKDDKPTDNIIVKTDNIRMDIDEPEPSSDFEGFMDDILSRSGRTVEEMSFRQYGNKVFISLTYTID